MIQDAARGKRCFLEPSHASAEAWSSRRRLCRRLGLERSDRGKRSCKKGVRGFSLPASRASRASRGSPLAVVGVVELAPDCCS